VTTRVRQSMARFRRDTKPAPANSERTVPTTHEKRERKDQSVPEKPTDQDDAESFTAVDVQVEPGIEEEPCEEYQVLGDVDVNYIIDE